MDDSTLIRRVRDEHRKLDEIKAALEAALDSGDRSNRRKWLDELRTRFEHFRAHLIHRIALEEIGGFLSAVVVRRPHLSRQVEHLRQAHQQMVQLAEDTIKNLWELSAENEDSLNQATLLVRIMLSEVQYHEEAEQLLVSFVMSQEVGGGD